MALVQIDWNPPPRVLRVFALSLVATAAVVAGVAGAYLGRGAVAYPVAGVLALLGLLALAGPVAVRRPVYRLVAGPAWVVGNVVTRVFLFVFFLLVVTPIGLVARLAGHDPLRLRSARPSYWETVTPDSARTDDRHERPF